MFIDTITANKARRPQTKVSRSTVTSPYEDSQTPLLETFVGQDAPPTYLEATTPGLHSAAFSRDAESARLLLSAGWLGDESRGEKRYEERGWTKNGLWRWIAAGIAMTTLVVILLIMLIAVLTGGHSLSRINDEASNRPAFSEQPQPATLDQTDGYIENDSDSLGDLAPTLAPDPTSLMQPPPPTECKEIFPIRWPSRCGKEYNVKTVEHDFGSPNQLNIQEAVHQLDGPYKHVSGWIHVVRAPESQAPGTIQAHVSYAVSPSVDVDEIKYSTSATSLIVGNPSSLDGFNGARAGSACLVMSIILYMATGTTIATLDVTSTHLGMQIHDGVEFTVSSSTTISLRSGTLDAAAFESRQTRLRTISGSITGKYALSDILAISTKSGSVIINVEPKESNSGVLDSAIFMVDSLSGSVRADFQRSNIPNRDYQNFVNTTVGTVDAALIHGSRTEIFSVAGFVTVDLLPYNSGDYQSTVNTQTHSGQTSLTMQSPYEAEGSLIAGMTSIHKTMSGSLDITYPPEWIGRIHGTSLSGSLHLQGKDLELLSENDQPGQNRVEAKKGTAGGVLTFDTVSGGCDIQVGQL